VAYLVGAISDDEPMDGAPHGGILHHLPQNGLLPRRPAPLLHRRHAEGCLGTHRRVRHPKPPGAGGANEAVSGAGRRLAARRRRRACCWCETQGEDMAWGKPIRRRALPRFMPSRSGFVPWRWRELFEFVTFFVARLRHFITPQLRIAILVFWSSQPRQIGTVNAPRFINVCFVALRAGCVSLRTNLPPSRSSNVLARENSCH
jgi:hypothetical protein